MYKYEGKVAVVSGVAKGIGKACAMRMAKEGCKMMLWDLPAKDGGVPEDFLTTIDEISAMGV